MILIEEKTNYLLQDIQEVFPKTIKEYRKQGYNNFNNDCTILLEFFNTGGEVPSEAVDCIWHSMILYTQKYFDWCIKHYGRIIHHIPNDQNCLNDCSSGGGCTGLDKVVSCTDTCSCNYSKP